MKFFNLIYERISWLALIILLLPFLAVLLFSLQSGVPDFSTSGDVALLEMATRNFRSGRIFTGPYSRFGFHHPGPIYFLVRIPLYYLFGRSASASYFTVSIICMLSLTGIFLLFKRYAHSTLPVVFCLISAMFLRSIQPGVWLQDWNAFVIIMPLFFSVAAFAAAGSGLHKYFPLAVLSGSFAAQTHIGCMPTIVIIGFAAVILYILPQNKILSVRQIRNVFTDTRKSLLFTILVIAVVWSPTIYEELSTEDNGNISRIIVFFRDTEPESVTEMVITEWNSIASVIEISYLKPELLRRMNLVRPLQIGAVLLRISFLILCWYFLKKKGGNRFIPTLCLISLLLHVTSLLSVLQIRGASHSYLFMWFLFIGPLSWVAVAGAVIELARIAERKYINAAVFFVSFILLISITLTNLAVLGKQCKSGPYDPLEYHDERVHVLSDSLSCYLDNTEERTWFIQLGDHQLWPVMTGVVNSLTKQSYDVHLDPAYSFMSDIPVDESANPLFLTSDSLIVPAEYRILVSYDGIVVGRK